MTPRVLILLAATATAFPCLAQAEALVATRMIRSQTVLAADDVVVRPETISGALETASSAVGLEAKVNIYAGRPIHAADLGPPATVERNQIITLNYFHAGLSIATEGRSLDRAGPGEVIRVMNLSSRTTVTGTVRIDGSVSVGPVSR